MSWYIDHLEVNWYQVNRISYEDEQTYLKVSHSEKIILSYDNIINHFPLSSGQSTNLIEDWIGKLIPETQRIRKQFLHGSLQL
jgi:hypothetical protein